jgi:hypothetical protein
VNFRVNEEEYVWLRQACARHGARSLSDFARLAVLGWAGSPDLGSSAVQWRMSALGHKVADLEGRLEHLLDLLEERDSASRPQRTEPGQDGCLLGRREEKHQ